MEIEQKIITIVILGTILLTILILVITLFMIIHQRKMLNSKLLAEKERAQHHLDILVNMNETQEKERSRIADTMHDQVGAVLFAAKVQAGILVSNLTDKENQKKASNIEELIVLGIEEMRKSIQALSPSLLEKFGFIKAIEEFVRLMNVNSDIKITFKHKSEYDCIGNKSEIAIYRVLQEAVNNSLKHSQASNIIIDISQNINTLNISINDDGIGFNANDTKLKAGLGLKNIEHRFFLLNGNVEMRSDIGKGTSYKFEVPNNQSEHKA